MTGMSNYSGNNFLNYICGQTPNAALPAVWMALMQVPNTDANTGGTEVPAANGYARVQVAGTLVAATAITGGTTTTITMPSNPGWCVPGMNVYDITAGKQIGTILTYVGTTLTLTAAASNTGTGSTDTLALSAFSAATGSAPSSITNGASITFPAATGTGWGTVEAFELRDAATVGNLLLADFLGNFPWRPFTATLASPSVLTCPTGGYANGTVVVISNEYGGIFPTGTGTWAINTVYTTAGLSGDTFNIATNATTGSGAGMIRQIVQQSIPAGVTASFAAAALVASGA